LVSLVLWLGLAGRAGQQAPELASFFAHSDDHIAGPQPESCKRLRQMSFV